MYKILNQAEVIERLHQLSILRENFNANGFDGNNTVRKFSIIQIELRESAALCGYTGHFETLLELLLVEASKHGSLMDLAPFFVSICTQTKGLIFGEIDWDSLQYSPVDKLSRLVDLSE